MSPAPAFRPLRNEHRSFVRRLNGRSRITGSLSIGSLGVTSADRLPPGPGGAPVVPATPTWSLRTIGSGAWVEPRA